MIESKISFSKDRLARTKAKPMVDRMKENNNFRMGMRDGIAIGVGYLAVAVIVCIALACLGRGLVTVALGGALSVLLTEVIIMLIGV